MWVLAASLEYDPEQETRKAIISKRIQYVLLDAEGEPAMRCHQDDLENPVIGDTIETLLDEAADWADLATD